MLVPGLKNLSYSEIRDLLWLSFLQHVESGIAEGKESAVEYCNGRMCDAFMRCFSDDVEVRGRILRDGHSRPIIRLFH